MTQRFRNRADAGRQLAAALKLETVQDVIVLGLPRGGIPVAYEVAAHFGVPLDVLIVRKLGIPGHEEMAMGAIASGGAVVLNREIVGLAGVRRDEIQFVMEQEKRELRRREAAYRGDRPTPELEGKIVVLVDDGLATGATMQAAIKALRQHHPQRIIVAIPVASQQGCREIGHLADEVLCLRTPADFQAVGLWYDNFGQTSDDEVRDLLQDAHADHVPHPE